MVYKKPKVIAAKPNYLLIVKRFLTYFKNESNFREAQKLEMDNTGTATLKHYLFRLER